MIVQGFHSEDSEDDNSDDEHDHGEGMSGDEQMQEQEDFGGSDEFDQVCLVPALLNEAKTPAYCLPCCLICLS